MLSQVDASSQRNDWIHILAQGNVGDKNIAVVYTNFILEVCRELAQRDIDAFVPMRENWTYPMKELPRRPETRKWGRCNAIWKLPDSVGELLEILLRGSHTILLQFHLDPAARADGLRALEGHKATLYTPLHDLY